jgi:hypothetical protein
MNLQLYAALAKLRAINPQITLAIGQINDLNEQAKAATQKRREYNESLRKPERTKPVLRIVK